MKLPFSSRPLYWKLIGCGIICVIVSLVWQQIHIGQAITDFEETMSGSSSMEDLTFALPATLEAFSSILLGVLIVGSLGLVSIIAGVLLFLWKRTQMKSVVNLEAG